MLKMFIRIYKFGTSALAEEVIEDTDLLLKVLFKGLKAFNSIYVTNVKEYLEIITGGINNEGI
ncbi:hypothetical protein [Clostridium sp. BL-8]|uniref:hypothetical protein n=1 Tax=Clostridium sp. BL-8 TaxID=349938 RepID=UPI00098CC1E0|nr:hypothetical protein [Clostridium sp. BL-8]OOM77358.1 hypothetical protein CLOBL_30360 [Clostridium sp. BL-8]